MPISQNLRFIATVPKDEEFDHPIGASLMRQLSIELKAGGWSTGELDNWRDCGWSMACHRDAAELEIVLSWVQRGYWLLQISPQRTPGLARRCLGTKASATAGDVQELALAIHRALSELEYLGSPQWRWDGFPDEAHSTPEPQAG